MSPTLQVGWRSSAPLVLVLVGCIDTLPIEYQTEHFEIGTELEHPLCAGDLAQLERIVARVEDEMDLQMPGRTTAYVWDDSEWDKSPENCDPLAYGCFDPGTQTISTSYSSLWHEVVHAVLGPVDPGYFLEEGLAEVYSGAQSRFGPGTPSENLSLPPEQTDRQSATHFVRWLREQWGPDKLGQLMRSRERDLPSAFEAIYGMKLSQFESLYLETAPEQYSSLLQCSAPPHTARAPGMTLFATFELSCAFGPHTHGVELGLYTSRTFSIDEPGHYQVQTSGAWIELYRCSPNRIEESVEQEGWLEDVPAHHTGFPSGASRIYFGDAPHLLYFEAGVHSINVGQEGHADGEVQLAIWPSEAG